VLTTGSLIFGLEKQHLFQGEPFGKYFILISGFEQEFDISDSGNKMKAVLLFKWSQNLNLLLSHSPSVHSADIVTGIFCVPG
jgi:hypothetical protein